MKFLVVALMLWTLPSLAHEEKLQKLFKHLETNTEKCLSAKNKHRCEDGKKSKHIGTGYCYRYVKIGLLKSGLVPNYLGGVSAVNSGYHLKKAGFSNILTKESTPENAPIGAILVFKVKNNKHGHIEVKTGENTYVSDYIRHKHPKDYKLIGVYIKIDWNPTEYI